VKHEQDFQPVGVYSGISNAEYHGGPGVSKSGLDQIAKSPAHFKQAREEGYTPPTPSQRQGTLAHSYILEHETFWDLHALPFEAPEGALDTVAEIKEYLKFLGQKIPSSAKKAELLDLVRAADPDVYILDDERAKYAAEVDNREIITAEELEKLEGMRASIMAHPKAGPLLEAGSGVAELSCYWKDPETGVLCRCRPDFWRHDGVIVDLKTARDASPKGFMKSIEGWRYYVQHAFYMDGIEAAQDQSWMTVHDEAGMPAPNAFIFVSVEPFAPYAVGVYHLDPVSIEIGRREYREDVARYAECMRTGKWPAYSDRIESISLPEWRLRQEEIEDEQGVYIQ
jgi:hypothetical protein